MPVSPPLGRRSLNMKMTEQQQRWIEDYCNETISPEEFSEFEKALEEDAELRKALRQYMALDAGLRSGSEPNVWLNTESDEQASNVFKFQGAWQWVAVAALLVLGLFIVFNPKAPPVQETVQREEPSALGFGVLTGVDGAVWKNHPDLSQGDLLPAGEIQLVSGIAQLELFSGVTVVVEGRAVFEVHSAMEMSVAEGKLRANVPEPAQGFRIHSAEGEVVDLGTEFAVEISEGKSEVHVIDGSVEWHPKSGAEKRLMEKGEALRSRADEVESLEAQADEFVGVQELTERLGRGRTNRHDEWLAFSRNLSRDKRLVAYYPMSQPGHWHRKLYNEAPTIEAATDGAIVAAKRSVNRFGESNSALDFSGTGSRVRLDVAQELTALTFLTWVKIDSLDRWYNSLLLTDGHELNEPHWQIMDDGRLFFSVKRRTYSKVDKIKDKHIVFSKPFWSPAMAGKWTQIAVTYDTSDFAVTHYVNGKPIHREVLPENMQVDRVKIGSATIGNWSEPTRNEAKFSVRNLNGSMDEFAIFSEALSAEEVAELYTKGKP